LPTPAASQPSPQTPAVPATMPATQPIPAPVYPPVQAAAQAPAAPIVSAEIPPRRKPKWLLITLVVFIVLAGGGIALSFGTINLVTNPNFDSISINGQATTKTKSLKLPGKYTIQIIKEGYVTYTKTIQLGFHGKFNLNQTLKADPQAASIAANIAGPLNLSSTTNGLTVSDTAGGNLVEALASSGETAPTFTTSNLNISPISGLKSAQFPDDMGISLLSTASGYKVLDLSKIQITSQLSKDLTPDILSATVAHTAGQLFYLQKDTKTGNNYIVRNTPDMANQSIYFDQPLITQLGINSPKFHFSYDDQSILAVDGKIIVIDVLARNGTAIGEDSTYVDAKFNIGDQMVYAINQQNELKTISATDAKVTTHQIATAIDKIWPVSADSAFILDNSGQFFSYNWSSQSKINYAIDSNYSQSISEIAVDINQKIVYFIANNQLYGQSLVRADYEADEQFAASE